MYIVHTCVGLSCLHYITIASKQSIRVLVLNVLARFIPLTWFNLTSTSFLEHLCISRWIFGADFWQPVCQDINEPLFSKVIAVFYLKRRGTWFYIRNPRTNWPKSSSSDEPFIHLLIIIIIINIIQSLMLMEMLESVTECPRLMEDDISRQLTNQYNVQDLNCSITRKVLRWGKQAGRLYEQGISKNNNNNNNNNCQCRCILRRMRKRSNL